MIFLQFLFDFENSDHEEPGSNYRGACVKFFHVVKFNLWRVRPRLVIIVCVVLLKFKWIDHYKASSSIVTYNDISQELF